MMLLPGIRSLHRQHRASPLCQPFSETDAVISPFTDKEAEALKGLITFLAVGRARIPAQALCSGVQVRILLPDPYSTLIPPPVDLSRTGDRALEETSFNYRIPVAETE